MKKKLHLKLQSTEFIFMVTCKRPADPVRDQQTQKEVSRPSKRQADPVRDKQTQKEVNRPSKRPAAWLNSLIFIIINYVLAWRMVVSITITRHRRRS